MKVNPLIRLCFDISEIKMIGNKAIITITPKRWFKRFFRIGERHADRKAK